MINNILIEVFGAIAKEERKKIRTREKEGIEIAKNAGKIKVGQRKNYQKTLQDYIKNGEK
ncbi:MAG: hypothetical protein ACRDCB_03515 [Clostridium sp.]|uniref:hypothetical protein n=1 Tax=Clostridium sp. TaxID=1506 RepID=UPI003EE52070